MNTSRLCYRLCTLSVTCIKTINTINIKKVRYFDVKKFSQYDILSSEISRYFKKINIEILPSTRSKPKSVLSRVNIYSWYSLCHKMSSMLYDRT